MIETKPHLFTMAEKPYLTNGVDPDILTSWEYVVEPSPANGNKPPEFAGDDKTIFKTFPLEYDEHRKPISFMSHLRAAPGIRNFAYGHDYVSIAEVYRPGRDEYKIKLDFAVYSKREGRGWVAGKNGSPCKVSVTLDGHSLEVTKTFIWYGDELPAESREDLEVKIAYLKRLVEKLRDAKKNGTAVPVYPPYAYKKEK